MGRRVIRLVPGSATAIGQVRAVNQDSVLVADQLYAVADGMGGHRGGEVASASALEALAAAVTEPSTAALVAGVETANAAVYRQSLTDPSLAGMGTTLVVIGVVAQGAERRLGIVNVGDSRAYLLAGDEFAQLSEDHSLVETLVRSGQLTEDEAANHPRRNVLTRALGIEPEVDVDAWVIEPHEGDRFILCSDGLFNELDDDTITTTLRAVDDPGDAARELVRQADAAGGRDNISVVVLDVVEVPEIPDALAAAEAADATIDERLTRVTTESDESAFVDTMAHPALLVASPAVGPAPPPVAAAPAGVAAPPRQANVSSGPVTPLPGANDDRRLTWRVAVFVLAVVAVVGLAFGAMAWTARSGYYVLAEAGQVNLYQGRQGGLLWFDPTLVQHTGINTADLRESDRSKLTAGKSFSDRSSADAFIAGLSRYAQQGLPSATTSSTTSTTPAGPTITVASGGP